MGKLKNKAIWVRCKDCDDYYCLKHKMHAADCKCPPIEKHKFCPYTGNKIKATK
jgi:hypothetical protein